MVVILTLLFVAGFGRTGLKINQMEVKRRIVSTWLAVRKDRYGTANAKKNIYNMLDNK